MSVQDSNITVSLRYEHINNKFKIIKRSGAEELFNIDKMLKVIKWATEPLKNSDTFTEILINDLSLKITDGMHIASLFNELIYISSSKISPIVPDWDIVAKRLYLLKAYKENYGIKRIGVYPHLKEILAEGIKHNIYDKDILSTYTDEDIEELNKAINPDRDLLFNYKGLKLMIDKYCKRIYNKRGTKFLELPQITYIVAAMHSHYTEKKDRIKTVIKAYDMLSNHMVTFSTPRLAYGLRPKAQKASCVLITMGDNTESILTASEFAAIYSRNMGGIGVDVSYVRCSGSVISTNDGQSDGPVPMIKIVEANVSAFNQQGKRKGSVVIYFPWWHADVIDLLMLKDSGGTEDSRARKCKYGMKINSILLERARNDEYVTLFDPKEVAKYEGDSSLDLNSVFGEKFEELYKKYENNSEIYSKKIKARELLSTFFKVRVETGNVYAAFMDNINEQELTGRTIRMSNLCCEITVPSRPPVVTREDYVVTSSGQVQIFANREAGEVGLCNLSSVNLVHWQEMKEEDKIPFLYTLMSGIDNDIDTQYYPVPEAEWPNKYFRPIGIGLTDFANLAAKNKLLYTDDAILQFTNDIVEDFYLNVYRVSNILAKERGAYAGFKTSNWAKGLTPYHMSSFRKKNPLNIEYKRDKEWNELAEEIMRTGVRFSLHSAIPPSATSGKVTNATESFEPVLNTFYVETGTNNIPTVVKFIKTHREYYQTAYSIPNKRILELAAVRQVHIDQAQSFNEYCANPNSVADLFLQLEYANELGIKTLYYFRTPKAASDLEECAACSV